MSIKIECLIKRQGGSEVPFGNNAATQVVYRFAPVDNSPNSPHVCEVDNDDHINRFLSIGTYRLFREAEKPVTSLRLPDDVDSYESPDKYDDLVGVNPALVDGDWLGGFSRDVLGIPPRAKAQLQEKLKQSYDEELDSKASCNDLLRAILSHMVEEQTLASNIAKGGIDAPSDEKEAPVKDVNDVSGADDAGSAG
jgi:hypothetical protein